MTVAQVADYLQISKKSVYQLVHEGKIPACKVMNKWRFDKNLVKEWVSNGQSAKYVSR